MTVADGGGEALVAEMELRRGRFHLGVRVEAARGEVLAVLGPNGSGKSTLLDVLAGLTRPDRATVRVGDRVLLDSTVDVPPHRRDVGLLAQNALLFPHLTVLANVAFGPRARGVKRAEANAIARHWLSEVDALEFVDRKPAALSGGQAQRIALARALAAEPALLLLDEPFAALDVDVAPALRGLVRRVLRTGKQLATVLVTHDPLDALVLADRVVVLSDGGIVEQGPTREVLSRPRTAFTARIAGHGPRARRGGRGRAAHRRRLGRHRHARGRPARRRPGGRGVPALGRRGARGPAARQPAQRRPGRRRRARTARRRGPPARRRVAGRPAVGRMGSPPTSPRPPSPTSPSSPGDRVHLVHQGRPRWPCTRSLERP